MGRVRVGVVVVCAGLVLSGCGPLASVPRPKWLGGGERGSPAAAGALLRQEADAVDLVAALVAHCPANGEQADTLDAAYLRFETCGGSDDEQYRRRRNRLQERLLASSNERCSAYKRRLQEAPAAAAAGTREKPGGLATTLGGLGMLFPPAAAVGGLAGAGALISQAASQPPPAIDAGLTVRVVTEGIDTRRAHLLQAMRARQREDPTGYPVEAAVGDALAYHEACSVVSGLEAAEAALAAADPGVGRMRAEFATSAAATAVMSIERARAELEAIGARVAAASDVAGAEAPLPEADDAREAIRRAIAIVTERAAVAAAGRARVAELAAQLAGTGEQRGRTQVVAELDAEVSRTLRASADVDEAVAEAAGAAEALARRRAALQDAPRDALVGPEQHARE